MFFDETDVTGTLMNRVYRIVWNASRQAWMVAAELTRGKTKSQVGRKKTLLKLISSSLIVSATLAFTGNALAFSIYTWKPAIGTSGDWNIASNWLEGNPPDTNTENNSIYIFGDTEATISNIIDLTANGNILYVRGTGSQEPASLVIRDGGQLSIANLNIAQQNLYEGKVLVSGENARLTVTDSANFGNDGNATFTLNNDATVTASTINLATNVGGTGTINIGAARGEAAVAGGTFEANRLRFGDGDGTLVFNHTNTDLRFSPELDGKGNVEFHSGTTTLTHYNNFLFTGDMDVKGGTLAIEAGKILYVGTGNYQQAADAKLQLGVYSNTTFAKLNVGGTATFAKDTGLDVNVIGVPLLTNGRTLSKVISAGTLNASTFTMTDNSLLYDFDYEISGNDVNLKVKVADSGGDSDGGSGGEAGNGVLRSVISEGFTPGSGAARVLDTFVNSGITGNDIGNVTTALGQLSTQKQVSDAVAETLPLLVEGTTRLASNTMRGTNRVIQSRQASNRGLSSGDEFLVDKAFWLKPVGSWSRQQERNGVSGYDADSYGFVGGIDGEVTPTSRLGFAVSYMNTDVDGNGSASGNSADIDAYQLIAYGSHDLTQFEDIEVSWQADVGLNKNDSKRYIEFMNRKATADYDSYTAHIGAGIGKRFQLTEQSLIMPSLRADYAYIKDESYTEKGAGAISLDVDSVNAEELILMAQVEANHQWSESTSLSTTLGVGYDVINDDTSLTASYTGGGAAFTTEGIDPSPWLARAGVGATMSLNGMTELTASYDLEGREDFLNQTASVNMRWRF